MKTRIILFFSFILLSFVSPLINTKTAGYAMALPGVAAQALARKKVAQVVGQQAQPRNGYAGDFNNYVNVTPAAKMIDVNTAMGQAYVAAMQGSSRALYDSLPLSAAAFNIRYFETVGQRIFPFTNISQNRLPPGESMAIQRIYFSVMIAAAPPVVTSVAQLSAVAATAGLYAGNFSVNIGQSEVVKKQPMTSMLSLFNKRAQFLNNDIMEMDNVLVIPGMTEFTVDVQLPNYTLVASSFLTLTLEGLGSLLNPKANY